MIEITPNSNYTLTARTNKWRYSNSYSYAWPGVSETAALPRLTRDNEWKGTLDTGTIVLVKSVIYQRNDHPRGAFQCVELDDPAGTSDFPVFVWSTYEGVDYLQAVEAAPPPPTDTEAPPPTSRKLMVVDLTSEILLHGLPIDPFTDYEIRVPVIIVKLYAKVADIPSDEKYTLFSFEKRPDGTPIYKKTLTKSDNLGTGDDFLILNFNGTPVDLKYSFEAERSAPGGATDVLSIFNSVVYEAVISAGMGSETSGSGE